MKFFAKKIIDFYRYFISPFLGQNCRFYPSCSEYSKQCYDNFSFFKASVMTLKRILRCHPYSKGGVDYPPGVNDDN